jgi:hypothetical protein
MERVRRVGITRRYIEKVGKRIDCQTVYGEGGEYCYERVYI